MRGKVRISGAKNAALPCLAACLLTDRPLVLRNIPAVRDIRTTCQLLQSLGVTIGDAPKEERGGMVAQAQTMKGVEAPWEMVRTMRMSSFCPRSVEAKRLESSKSRLWRAENR